MNDNFLTANIDDIEIESEISNFVVMNGNADEYIGDYVVTPNLEEQTMLTKNKVMVEDVTIKSIPISVVSNTSGGNTVIIGG